jgi:hypothetical protein
MRSFLGTASSIKSAWQARAQPRSAMATFHSREPGGLSMPAARAAARYQVSAFDGSAS